MNEYEVTDLFEAGDAGDIIQAKLSLPMDEVSGPLAPEEVEN